MTTNRTLEIGDHVIHIDSRRRRFNALVTAVHGEIREVTGHDGEKMLSIPCINLTYVSGDARKIDEYGQQLEREATSCVHRSDNSANANCWIFPDEE
jgi:hypothetical protein